MPPPRDSLGVAAIGTKVYAIGGWDEEAQSAKVEIYDTVANTWSNGAPLPLTLSNFGAAVLNGKIYVIGGRLGSAFIFTASKTNVVEEYDPATDQWGLVRARMPTERSGGAWGVYNGRIYVAGGEHQDGHLMAAFRALEAYDPATNSWSELPMMPMPRHGLAGAVVGHRLHLASGDIQSAGITGMHVVTDAHDIFEFSDR